MKRLIAWLRTLWRRLRPARHQNWRELGQARGRTARAEPEGTLHIKVIRANGAVEDHGTVPAHKVN